MNKDPFYKEGYEDYLNGADLKDCPYLDGTDGEYGWVKGWKAAEKEEKRNLAVYKR